MKKIAILGSTGSIGTSTLRVIDHLEEQFEVSALAAHSNIDLLQEQVERYKPRLVAVYDETKANELRQRLSGIEVVPGIEGLKACAALAEVDLVVTAVVGSIGLEPTLTAIQHGKDIALANKETLVAGGELVMQAARDKGVQILPVDSEHSALFQCLNGENLKEVSKLVLTASGGPFRSYTDEQLASIQPSDALNHPTWVMGAKVTIDCSTLMNKGLEVIEAHWLFSMPKEKIDVVVHPQSTIHSMVEFCDGSTIAQLGTTDMCIPIQYALTYPKRQPTFLKPFSLTDLQTLTFYPPDTERFRCLRLAYVAMEKGGTMACFMNAANEALVDHFIQGEISWLDIGKRLEALMNKHEVIHKPDLAAIQAVEKEAREQVMMMQGTHV